MTAALPQTDMFAPPHSDRDTSLDAANAIRSVAGRLRLLVLNAIREQGGRGACNHELEAALGLAGNTVRPRVWELRRFGLVEDSGLRRPTPSGRQAVAWRVKP
jgi:predicted transcriptional regulator